MTCIVGTSSSSSTRLAVMGGGGVVDTSTSRRRAPFARPRAGPRESEGADMPAPNARAGVSIAVALRRATASDDDTSSRAETLAWILGLVGEAGDTTGSSAPTASQFGIDPNATPDGAPGTKYAVLACTRCPGNPRTRVRACRVSWGRTAQPRIRIPDEGQDWTGTRTLWCFGGTRPRRSAKGNRLDTINPLKASDPVPPPKPREALQNNVRRL